MTPDELENIRCSRSRAVAAITRVDTPDAAHAYEAALERLLTGVNFDLADIRDPRGGRRPTAAAERRKRKARAHLFHLLAVGAIEVLTAPKPKDPTSRRRRQRFLGARTRELLLGGNPDEAERVARGAVVLGRVLRYLADQQRRYRTFALNLFVLDVDDLFVEYTTLSPNRRRQRINEILRALNLSGSVQAASVRQRLQRLKRGETVAGRADGALFGLTKDLQSPVQRVAHRVANARTLRWLARADVDRFL